MKHASDDAVAVRLSGLTVKRGHREVLSGLTLDIAVGKVTGVLGPSGCGKTTLLRSIVGAQANVGGDVRVLGLPAGSRELRTRVAYATQAASVYDDLSVMQNLGFFASALGAPKGDAERVVDLVGLRNEAKQRVESLSGGQRNRVSLAAALLGSPELIVLDEPTVGLDPVLRAELWDLFARLAGEGAALIVSSHVMDEALRCDRLLLLREGEVIADTTPHALLSDTGAPDPESAFLEVIRAHEGGAS
ncbi:ABC transporter ATP-binding protein [Leucobacter denitrificans]|uniref:ABC transporter ATP-binding protein n=1 Tax=Leucobacter denitrificans TaxID=683042 RepID=A0A7G9S2Q0_9MICO|nr:ABC transporter ATP-binding protein [Leucobacter denitrificans]QNN62125.1 ABC transporter ATP-binding protein [Leucobacter denitrificans]